MNRFDKADDPRRRLLIQALAAGFFATGLSITRAAAAEVFGTRPSKLPPGQSIYRFSGDVMVNGKAVTLQTPITASDTLETGRNSEIVFVVNDNAFLLRGESHVALESAPTDSIVLSGLRLLSGKLLSVFPPKKAPLKIYTTTATAGIRGTGVYVEADPERTYFCTCYGVVELTANNDRQGKVTVRSKHHDRPLYILGTAQPGRSIRRASIVNHTDQELLLVETLVGRKLPFVPSKDGYGAPSRK